MLMLMLLLMLMLMLLSCVAVDIAAVDIPIFVEGKILLDTGVYVRL